MKSSVGASVTFLVLVTVSASASASVTVSVPADRDAIVATPHKKNNDGSWGYGWIRKTTRSLIGFDIRALEGRTVEDAYIRLYVAQNHFTAKGTTIVAHPWEPAQQVEDWREGANLFNRFSYCGIAEYGEEAREYPPLDDPTPHAREGATWKCSVDDDYLRPGINCDPLAVPPVRWSPMAQPEGQRGVHEGFRENIDARTAMNPRQNITTEEPCGGSVPCPWDCHDSIACIRNGGTADDCWRSVKINVTRDLQEALAIPGYRDPSWMIKRGDEHGEGAFHWFSREGALCNRGPQGTSGLVGLFQRAGKDSSALQPVLVVRLAGATPVAVPTPAVHCDAYE